ncbi:Fic family protein [Streptomyces umbrinus]|uniref:Fic family protein n=1 Tax=Streptomyces umbrinus TaxID=67370 RepID=UPI003448A04F
MARLDSSLLALLHAAMFEDLLVPERGSLLVGPRGGGGREVALRTPDGFHHEFVSIMPFPDGNGRVARTILDQAAFELCRRGVASNLTADRPAYFKALRATDTGDLNPLVERLRAALTQGGEA